MQTLLSSIFSSLQTSLDIWTTSFTTLFVLNATWAAKLNSLQASQAPLDKILLRKSLSRRSSQDVNALSKGFENELEENEMIKRAKTRPNDFPEIIPTLKSLIWNQKSQRKSHRTRATSTRYTADIDLVTRTNKKSRNLGTSHEGGVLWGVSEGVYSVIHAWLAKESRATYWFVLILQVEWLFLYLSKKHSAHGNMIHFSRVTTLSPTKLKIPQGVAQPMFGCRWATDNFKNSDPTKINYPV